MSNPKRSWESVYDFAKRHMRKDAPLYFNEPHITTLTNMMMEITNQQQISIVRTGLPLPEPIVSRHGSHFISWSMIAMIINAPYKREPVPIEISERPDPFQAVLKEMRKQDKKRPQLSISKKQTKRAKRQEVDTDSDSSDQDVVRSERNLYFERFITPLERQKAYVDEEAECIRLLHALRLAVTVIHWYEHFAHEIPYTDQRDAHKGFRGLEFAKQRCRR